MTNYLTMLLSLGCWLILARRFCVYNADLKVYAAREILTVIMTSNDKNVHSCKRHTVVRQAFCFWWSLCPFLASTHYRESWSMDSNKFTYFFDSAGTNVVGWWRFYCIIYVRISSTQYLNKVLPLSEEWQFCMLHYDAYKDSSPIP